MLRRFDNMTLMDLLHRASQCAEDLFEHQLGSINLTARQYAILRAVAKKDRLTQTDIVESTGIDRSTVAEMTRRLVAKGLLQRRRSGADARAYAVRLTEAGRTMIEAAGLARKASEERVYAAVRSLPRAQVRDVLVELIEASEAAKKPGTEHPKRKR
jgi:DNA-binding MarR family transcriptional regulator